MDVVISSDQGYFELLATVVSSLARHDQRGDAFVVHVLNFGIAADDCALLRGAFPALDLRFVEVGPDLVGEFPDYAWFSKATYGRLLIGELLPVSVSRVLYLDADVVVRRPLVELAGHDLGGHVVAACRDQFSPTIFNVVPDWRSIGLDPSAPYMNSGVMLIDLEKWRAVDFGRSVIENLHMHRESIRFADQDALNITLNGSFCELPPSFNAQTTLRSYHHFAYTYSTPEQVREATENPHIVHFTGKKKPWDSRSSDPMADLWRTTRRELSFLPALRLQSPSMSQRVSTAVRRIGRRILAPADQ